MAANMNVNEPELDPVFRPNFVRFLESACQKRKIYEDEFFDHLEEAKATRVPTRESYESPYDTFNTRFQQIKSEIDALLSKVLPMLKDPGSATEAIKHLNSISELTSQQASLNEDFKKDGLQKHNDYIAELYGELIQREKTCAQLEKPLADWRAKLPPVQPISPTEALTPPGSTNDVPSPDNRYDTSQNKDDVIPETAIAGQGEKSNNAPENAPTPTSDTRRADEPPQRSVTASETSELTRRDSIELEGSSRKRKLVTLKIRSDLNANNRKKRKTKKARKSKKSRLRLEEFTAKASETAIAGYLPPVNDDNTVDFSNMYHNGIIMSFCMIVQHPPDSNQFYIFYCRDHDKYMSHYPLHGVGPHIGTHNNVRKSPSMDLKVQMFGMKILGCTPELVTEYSNAVHPWFARRTRRAIQQKKLEKAIRNDTSEVTESVSTTQKKFASYSRPQAPPARRCAGRSVGNWHRITRHTDTSITTPRIGKIYHATKESDNETYAAMVLPFGSFKPLGFDGHITSTTLLENPRRRSHARNLETLDYIWSKGYEDGGPKEHEREFPIIYFDNSPFPEKVTISWARASALLKEFDPNDTNIRYRKTVIDFMNLRKKQGCTMDINDDEDSNRTESPVTPVPSVPATRNSRPNPQIDAYFEGAGGFDSDSDFEMTDDHEDDDYDDDDMDYAPGGEEGREPSSKTIHVDNGEQTMTLGDSEEYPYEILSDDDFIAEYLQMPMKEENARDNAAEPDISEEPANSSPPTSKAAPDVPTVDVPPRTDSERTNTTAYFAPISPQNEAASATRDDNSNEPHAEGSGPQDKSFGQIQPTIPGLVLLQGTKSTLAEARIKMDELRKLREHTTAPLLAGVDAYIRAAREATKAAAGLNNT